MNRFYQYPPFLKWSATLVLLMIALACMVVLVEKTFQNPLNYLMFFLFVPVVQFALTPIFTLTGAYRYYSPLLLGYFPNDKRIDLHTGGSFDYLFVMKGTPSGLVFRRKVMRYQLEGLLNLIERIRSGEVPETVAIEGTSYFFNERSIRKLGFEVQNPTLFYRINLFVNFIDLTWMYSLAKGRFTFPRLWEAKKVYITGAELVAQKDRIAGIYNHL
jgi:hypothetical protein